MKNAALILITLTLAALAGTSLDDTAKAHIKAMRDDGSITNVIKLLVADGTLCRVQGHHWEHGCPIPGCLVIHAGPIRHCTTCGTTQTQKVGPWLP